MSGVAYRATMLLGLVPAIGGVASVCIPARSEDTARLNPAPFDLPNAVRSPKDAAVPSGDEIGGGDRLKVTIFGNPELSGVFGVQANGTILMPKLGAIPVAGKSAVEVAKEISARFDTRANQVANNVVVDVAEWRPVYISGVVAKPGSFVYRPGMTVLQVISMAGGFFRIGDGDISTYVNVAQNAAHAREYVEQIRLYLVKQASLEAEKAGEPTIQIPKRLIELGDEPASARLLKHETRALALRIQSLNAEKDARLRQVELTRGELQNYRKQHDSIMEDLAAARVHMKQLASLVAKGVVRRPDVLELENYVERLQTDGRDVFARMARAERDLAKYEQELADLPMRHMLKIEEEQAELQQRLSSSEALLRGAHEIVDQVSGEGWAVGQTAPGHAIAILRRNGGKETFMTAQLTDQVQPGDVVVVSTQKDAKGEFLTSGDRARRDRSGPIAGISTAAVSSEPGLISANN